MMTEAGYTHYTGHAGNPVLHYTSATQRLSKSQSRSELHAQTQILLVPVAATRWEGDRTPGVTDDSATAVPGQVRRRRRHSLRKSTPSPTLPTVLLHTSLQVHSHTLNNSHASTPADCPPPPTAAGSHTQTIPGSVLSSAQGLSRHVTLPARLDETTCTRVKIQGTPFRRY